MDDKIPINTAPWRSFLDKLKGAGVKIAHSQKSNFPYLYREVGGKVLWYPLPENFDEQNPDQFDPVGCWRFEVIIRTLDIDRNKYFKGWYLVL